MGASFNWNPASFEDAVRLVTSATGITERAMVNILLQMGSLSCPAPDWDSKAVYRIGLAGGKPRIEKLQPNGSWGSAEFYPPRTSLAETRQRDQKFGILGAPSLLNGDLLEARGPLGIALIYLDVDGFKQVNTKFTETVVDQKILPVLQQHLLAWTGNLGHVYAEGGDEIVILLPNCTARMSEVFAEEIRQRVAALRLPVGNEVVSLTISLGLAVASNAQESASLKLRANEAKKQAKLTGKNKVVIYQEEQVPE